LSHTASSAEGETAASRAAYAALMARVAETDLITALREATFPDGIVHVQNGDVGPAEIFFKHADITLAAFSEMEMEVEDVIFLPDRYCAQVRLTGTAAGRNPIIPAGYRITSVSCWMARVDAAGHTVEFWPYLNPGFFFSFPPVGYQMRPPAFDGAASEDARALGESWTRAVSVGMTLFEAVSASLAPDGVVHLGNGDIGPASVLRDIEAKIKVGIPDLEMSVDSMLFADHRVIMQFGISGTHGGTIGVYPPTGEPLPSTGALVGCANCRGQASQVWLYVAPVYSAALPPGTR
jgi:predicted ester cyclase